MSYQSWDWGSDGGYFRPKENNQNDSPRGYAIRAIKVELKWQGYDDGPVPMKDNGYYGTNMVPSVKNFQTEHGLIDDGVIGPRTMKELCRRRVLNFEAGNENRVEIPDHLLCRTIDLESAWYPACRNTTEDYGIAQIHDPLNARYNDGSRVCPGGDWQYAYRVGVNVRYLAEHLRKNYKSLKGYAPAGTSEDDLWRAAVFAHNAPAWAQEWMLAGYPCEGGGIVTVGDWKGEKFEWACLYTHAVYSRSC